MKKKKKNQFNSCKLKTTLLTKSAEHITSFFQNRRLEHRLIKGKIEVLQKEISSFSIKVSTELREELINPGQILIT